MSVVFLPDKEFFLLVGLDWDGSLGSCIPSGTVVNKVKRCSGKRGAWEVTVKNVGRAVRTIHSNIIIEDTEDNRSNAQLLEQLEDSHRVRMRSLLSQMKSIDTFVV